ncbi:uncharacterized protein EV420DRAFT_1635211 [Desarmillaria tabescens]|uniref:Uncharacterized protein n=1 Tax=Armillaria tabescens TaxID=1929756 RepID=A0AA39NLP7_ARMTA|nr:uncharacterized protein EV420DRAFT_1635211 [Desarmillaria tabescens]KAK0467942.1 hypothetical protein EV420DRAFT_1635211 [Desarmillaria tabescens]
MLSLFPGFEPQLPSFTSLLIQGPYHASAPIHLALSHTSQANSSSAIFLSPSNQLVTVALKEYNDSWLAIHSGQGRVSEMSSRVKMLVAVLSYPPTPTHLAFLLASLEVPQQGSTHILHPKTTLDAPPGLIILHELSAYFLSDVESNPTSHSWTVSSYMSLVIRALSFAAFLSSETPGGTSVVLFDSQLHRLKLPVVKQDYHYDNEGRNRARSEAVGPLMQKYFQTVGTFGQDDDNSEFPVSALTRRRLSLYKAGQDDPINSWSWNEKRSSLGTVFEHDYHLSDLLQGLQSLSYPRH